MANRSNVGAFAPRVGGGIFYAPAGTELPSNANDPLPEAFQDLGYITSDGVTETIDGLDDGEAQVAWGGIVLRNIADDGATHSFSTQLFELANAAAAQVLYGEENVVSSSNGFSVKINPGAIGTKEFVFVIDTVDKTSSKYLRICIPSGTIYPSGDTQLTHSELNFVEVTINAQPDSNGVTVSKYITNIPDGEAVEPEGDGEPGNNEDSVTDNLELEEV